MRKDPIFIVGMNRSGSTLLAKVLQQSRELAAFHEMHFLDTRHKDFRYFLSRSVGDLSVDGNVRKMVDLLFSPETIPGIQGTFWRGIRRFGDPALEGRIAYGIQRSDRSLGSIFSTIIEQITEHRGYDRCFVKFPVWLEFVPRLVEWYPDCRILHITRDPRAIAVSAKYYSKGRGGELIARHPRFSWAIQKARMMYVTDQYIKASRLHQQFRDMDNYTLFLYEDLLHDPEATVRRVCEIAGIEFSQKLLSPHGEEPSSITGERAGGFDRTAASRWEKVITPFEKRAITALTRTSMDRFGYDPENHPISHSYSSNDEKYPWRRNKERTIPPHE